MTSSPVHAPTQNTQPEDEFIDLGTLLGTLWRGKWYIAILMVLVMMAGAYYAFVAATPLYKSTAVVILDTRKQQVVDLQSVMTGLSGDTSEVNSEVEVLRGRGLMSKVVQELDLTHDPEFNTDLQAPNLVARAVARLQDLLGLPSEAGTALTPQQAQARTMNETIDTLLKKVGVRNIPLTLVFQITAESEDPEKSSRIANTIVKLYVLNQLEVKYQATQQATEWLTGRVTELQAKLETAEKKVKDFNSQTDLISAETLQALQRQMKESRDRILAARTAARVAGQRAQALRSARGRDAQAAAAADSQLNRFLLRLKGASDPAVATAFDTRFAQILARADLEARRAASQLEALQKSQAELEGQINRQSQDLITLQQLTREADASRLLYQYFLGRLNETSAQQGVQQADSHILSEAVVPLKPSAPRKSLIIVLSAVVGLILGFGGVLLREARQNTFRDARELERYCGRTVLGQIPLLPVKKRRAALQYLADSPTSAAAEAVRNLRTSILLSNVDKPPQVILSTSALPGEGKTTLAMALAQNLSGMGKNVLLVEGDIRRRVFSHYLDAQQSRGVLSVLTGEAELQDCVLHDETIGADVLVGQQSSTNAADLFSSEKFANFLNRAREIYDTIIIDTPPVLVVPDARVIGQAADAIICVVKWDSTSKAQVEEALRMFETVNLRITGMVMSQINPRGMKRYGYGSKYGAYTAYGRKYYTN